MKFNFSELMTNRKYYKETKEIFKNEIPRLRRYIFKKHKINPEYLTKEEKKELIQDIKNENPDIKLLIRSKIWEGDFAFKESSNSAERAVNAVKAANELYNLVDEKLALPGILSDAHFNLDQIKLDVLKKKGKCLYKLERFLEAKKCFKRAVNLSKEEFQKAAAKTNLAETYFKLHKIQKADSEFLDSLKILEPLEADYYNRVNAKMARIYKGLFLLHKNDPKPTTYATKAEECRRKSLFINKYPGIVDEMLFNILKIYTSTSEATKVTFANIKQSLPKLFSNFEKIIEITTTESSVEEAVEDFEESLMCEIPSVTQLKLCSESVAEILNKILKSINLSLEIQSKSLLDGIVSAICNFIKISGVSLLDSLIGKKIEAFKYYKIESKKMIKHLYTLFRYLSIQAALQINNLLKNEKQNITLENLTSISQQLLQIQAKALVDESIISTSSIEEEDITITTQIVSANRTKFFRRLIFENHNNLDQKFDEWAAELLLTLTEIVIVNDKAEFLKFYQCEYKVSEKLCITHEFNGGTLLDLQIYSNVSEMAENDLLYILYGMYAQLEKLNRLGIQIRNPELKDFILTKKGVKFANFSISAIQSRKLYFSMTENLHDDTWKCLVNCMGKFLAETKSAVQIKNWEKLCQYDKLGNFLTGIVGNQEVDFSLFNEVSFNKKVASEFWMKVKEKFKKWEFQKQNTTSISALKVNQKYLNTLHEECKINEFTDMNSNLSETSHWLEQKRIKFLLYRGDSKFAEATQKLEMGYKNYLIGLNSDRKAERYENLNLLDALSRGKCESEACFSSAIKLLQEANKLFNEARIDYIKAQEIFEKSQDNLLKQNQRIELDIKSKLASTYFKSCNYVQNPSHFSTVLVNPIEDILKEIKMFFYKFLKTDPLLNRCLHLAESLAVPRDEYFKLILTQADLNFEWANMSSDKNTQVQAYNDALMYYNLCLTTNIEDMIKAKIHASIAQILSMLSQNKLPLREDLKGFNIDPTTHHENSQQYLKKAFREFFKEPLLCQIIQSGLTIVCKDVKSTEKSIFELKQYVFDALPYLTAILGKSATYDNIEHVFGILRAYFLIGKNHENMHTSDKKIPHKLTDSCYASEDLNGFTELEDENQ